MRIHTDYSGCDLSGRTFFDVPNLHEADFTHVLAVQTEFSDSDLSGADFRGATLTGVRFAYCDLRDACFTDALCRGTSFLGCTWRGSELCDAWLDESTVLEGNHTVSLEDEERLWRMSQQATRPDTEQPILLGKRLVPSRETQARIQERVGVLRLFSARETAYMPSFLERLFCGNRNERGQ